MDSPQPRKVLFVINVMALLGGAEVQLGILAKGLVRAGYEVKIACIWHGHGDLSSLEAEMRSSSWDSRSAGSAGGRSPG